jgi:hypothetical protein
MATEITIRLVLTNPAATTRADVEDAANEAWRTRAITGATSGIAYVNGAAIGTWTIEHKDTDQ